MITYRPLHEIRALTFDLDDTLYDNMPYIYAAEASLRHYVKTHFPIAASISPEQWKICRQHVLRLQPELVNDIGTLRKKVLHQGFTQAGMKVPDLAQAVDACFSHFYYKRSDFSVSPAVVTVLKELSEKVPLAAITNGNVNCKQIGIADYFSHIIHACPKYPLKPNVAMFRHISKALNIPPKHILHVGDDLEKDVKGAILAGYQSAWFAVNRKMNLNQEATELLPTIQLSSLHQLTTLLP
ncbi:MAG: HAD-IA family hydrolase [Glaciecola sp.]